MNPTPRFRFPHDGESALHFCETIAHSHGWQSVNQLLVACDHKRIVNWNKPSKSIQSALEAIIAPFEYERPLNLLALQPKPNSQKQLKVCLQCINDSQPHVLQNQMPFNTHCRVHNSQLIDNCLSCGASIKSSVKSYCCVCNEELQCSNDEREYQIFARRLNTDSDKFLKSLLELSMYFIRPYDLFEEPVNWDALDNSQITHLMAFAFKFLITDDAMLQYEKMLCIKHIDRTHLTRGIFNLKLKDVEREVNACKKLAANLLPCCQYPTLFEESNFETTSGMVSPKRAKLASKELEALVSHCSASQLAKLFGTNTQAICKLVKEGIIKPLIGAKRAADMVFGIETSIAQINESMFNVHPRNQNEYVSLSKLFDKSLDAFGLDKSDIINASLRCEIPAYFDALDKSHGGQFKVQADAFLNYLGSSIRVYNHMTVSDFAKRLLVPECVVTELIKQCDELYFAKYVKVGPLLIDQSAAEAFLINYVCLNREAWLHSVSPNEVKSKLGTSCYSDSTLVFKVDGSHTEYTFFKKNEYLTNSLKLIFDDLPYRVFAHKYGRQKFPTIEKSISSINFESLENVHAI